MKISPKELPQSVQQWGVIKLEFVGHLGILLQSCLINVHSPVLIQSIFMILSFMNLWIETKITSL